MHEFDTFTLKDNREKRSKRITYQVKFLTRARTESSRVPAS